jgi:NAD-dependent dihydropyrimidine dehydrogenase PreA subunit
MSFTIICENNEKERCVMKNLKELTYDELVAHVEEVIKMLRLRAYEEGYEQGKFDAIVESSVKEARKLIAQLTRDDIIEMAKRDVAELKNDDGFYVVEDFYDCYADFKVNSEKRTVVALMRGKRSWKVYARGIAKCHPDDCFNAHIGRAIALRRALGLEVPDEYLNAPQPTEVRVGDIIQWEHVDCDYQVISLENKFPNVIGINRDGSRFEACGGNFYHHGMKIIDDSREEV